MINLNKLFIKCSINQFFVSDYRNKIEFLDVQCFFRYRCAIYMRLVECTCDNKSKFVWVKNRTVAIVKQSLKREGLF